VTSPACPGVILRPGPDQTSRGAWRTDSGVYSDVDLSCVLILKMNRTEESVFSGCNHKVSETTEIECRMHIFPIDWDKCRHWLALCDLEGIPRKLPVYRYIWFILSCTLQIFQIAGTQLQSMNMQITICGQICTNLNSCC